MKSLGDMAQEIVATIRFVTGMDRVVLHKLNEDVELVRKLYRRSVANQRSPLVSADVSELLSDTTGWGNIRGILLIPLMDQAEHFTAWFRRERRLTQEWAGAPNEKSASGSKRDRLMPRSSFEVHIREIIGRNKDWDNHDLDIAERFNRVFMAYALDTHEKMRENLSNLQEQNRYRNEFLATLAHELRNPLAPIGTGLSVLEREPDTDTMQKVIARMQRQVANMTTMIDGLMDVYCVTNGKDVDSL